MSTLEHPQNIDTAAGDISRWSLLHTAAATMATGGVLLLIDVIINPGPGLDHVNSSLYVSGHLLNAAAYVALVLGLPALAVALGRSRGVLGTIGYACLEIRYILSTGSQLFQAGIYHALARQPGLRAHLEHGQNLSSIYGRWDDVTSLLLGMGMLALVPALWRAGRTMRAPALMFLLIAVTEIVFTPVSLLLVAVLVIWLGLRIIRFDDIRRPLRRRSAS